MKGDSTETLISLLIVIAIVILFFGTSQLYIKKFCEDFGKIAVFERSSYTFIISNISNLLEAVFNITNWALYWSNNHNIESILLASIIPSVYSTRLYAASMALRVYRTYLLSRLRSGKVSEELFKKRSSFWWIFLVSNIYSILMLCGFIGMATQEVDEYRINIYNSIVYGFESGVFVFMSYQVFSESSHPTIVVEYVFYGMIWASGSFNMHPTFGNRWLYQIPIRNLLLLSVSLFSIYEHAKLIRPPLPSNICVSHIFEIEELYYDFIEFLTENKDENMLEVSNIYMEYSKAEYMQSYTQFDELFKKSKIYLYYQTDSFFENKFDSIKRYLMETLESTVSEYLMSLQHRKFIIYYRTSFN